MADTMDNSELVSILARILYEVKENKVSVDVAFKRVCKGRCVKSLEERERLYEISRRFISDYIRIVCCSNYRRLSYRGIARLWLNGVCNELLNELHCIYSYPKWFVDRLLELMPKPEVERLLESMNKKVLWLRVNTLKSSIEGVLRGLDNEGVECVTCKEVPYMVKVLKTRKPLRLLSVVKEFKAIPQDLSSAAVVEALKPEPGDYILDLTAAPGMKTSLIMMLTDNKAKVVACDLSLRRVLIMRNLLKKLGIDLSRVNIIHTNSIMMNYRITYDKVLLDAPCSNSGAIGKDPSIKVILTEGKVQYNSTLQFKLLSKALSLANYITFSTCSILPEEGELVISRVLDRVKLVRPLNWVSNGYSIVSFNHNLMRLMPHIHESEGFFISTLQVV